jgi:hypothetical protein
MNLAAGSETTKDSLIQHGTLTLLNRILLKQIGTNAMFRLDNFAILFALEALLHLSFSEKNRVVLREKYGDLLGAVRAISRSSSAAAVLTGSEEDSEEDIHEKILKAAEGVLFLIDEISVSGVSKRPLYDIMISYCWAESKQHANALCSLFERWGLTVWLDVRQIRGSTFEKMAEGIESSRLVVICIGERYERSASCRLECEYAAVLGRTIVPVYTTTGYTARGWLGLIVGGKKYYKLGEEKLWKLKEIIIIWDELIRDVRQLLTVDLLCTSSPSTSSSPLSTSNSSLPLSSSTTSSSSSSSSSSFSSFSSSSTPSTLSSSLRSSGEGVSIGGSSLMLFSSSKEWGIDEVCEWLRSLPVSESVIDSFQKEKMSGVTLKELWELYHTSPSLYLEICQSKFHYENMGDVFRVLAALREMFH